MLQSNKLKWHKYTLQFRQAAGTSRGVLRTKDSYFLVYEDDALKGIGECGLLRGLSADDRPDYEAKLNWLVANMHLSPAELFAELKEFPSIQFGYEMLLKDLESKDHVLFPSPFTDGTAAMLINGLIWMGDEAFMREQIESKLQHNFKVLKMKVGAIDWETEHELLTYIRSQFPADRLELRVDANGAFSAKEAPVILEQLAKLEVHSIEQPIKPKQLEEMAALCENTPVPIALDEELIGLFDEAEKRQVLDTIKPQYIILKPSFIGGWRGSMEWIQLAKEYNAGYWVTSALESNIGLNAIAQWNYTLQNPMPSGLGTGSLYTNNINSPLEVEAGFIRYNTEKDWGVFDQF
jgi:o-succinylbenzoate synthase